MGSAYAETGYDVIDLGSNCSLLQNNTAPVTNPTNTGGGGTTNAYPPNIPDTTTTADTTINPCVAARNAAAGADTLYNNSAVKAGIAKLANLQTDTSEQSFAMYQKLKYASDDNGAPLVPAYDSVSAIQTTNQSHEVTTDYTSYPASSTTVFVGTLHTHTGSALSAPSAVDVKSIIQSEIDNPGTQTGFVLAVSGDVYALQVTDMAKAVGMKSTITNSIDTIKHGWIESSKIGQAFQDAKDYYKELYKNDPNKDNLAYENAQSAVLCDTGVTLTKQDATGDFQPIRQTVIPVTDGKGKTTITYGDAGCD